jgi:hypothetical protein
MVGSAESASSAKQLERMHSELCREIFSICGPTLGKESALALDPIARRLLVRSVFSYIEGMSHALKMQSQDQAHYRLTAGEVLLVQEVAYDLDDNGTIRERPAKLRTLANLLFSIRLSTRSYGIENRFTPDLSGDGWRDVRAASRIRDRITHPRTLEDLTITNEEIGHAVGAVVWLLEQVERLNVALDERTEEILAEAEARNEEIVRLEEELARLRARDQLAEGAEGESAALSKAARNSLPSCGPPSRPRWRDRRRASDRAR